MLSLSGYQITEKLHYSNKTRVYRGYRESNHCPVIFKTLCDEYPSPKDLARLQHEFALTKDWDLAGVLKSHALVRHQNSQVLIQQDIGGVALNHMLANGPLPLETFFALALPLVHSLSQIHQCHLIHKDINPANLVVNLETMQIQIIDFGIATRLSRETPQLQNPGHLEGTLAYLSPEQTGRMNRAIDYRSDFYSLGATFYEMLTGVPPFDTTDPMELVHCHLAKTPRPAHQRQPGIPPVLSNLIQKLMAKTAEARYQSAFGLIADLEACRALVAPGYAADEADEADGTDGADKADPAPILDATPADTLVLGRHDISGRFQIPQKLYGREAEIGQLLDAFDRISQGQTEMLLVAGYSGVGKTDLVHELHKPISGKNGYCIDGKFDQFQRDIPYASLIQAFQELLRQLLTESPAQIARWKTLLSDALGDIAQVIIDVIPEVEWILGPQLPVPELPPAQAQNRFNLVFQQFIRTFTTAEHPLVLFLDDLQWADLASLQLLKLFMTTPETRHLLLIGAYRDNEVSAAHPLMLMLEEINKTSTRIDTITLKPLDGDHVRQLLAETLHCDPAQCKELTELAELCLQKTSGNPFFLGQFLHALAHAGQIRFNHQAGRWEWDMAALQHTQITSNVVELMAAKIQSLPPATQSVLQLAACVGNQFDLTTLTWAAELSLASTGEALWPALQERLLVPLNEGYKYLASNATEPRPASNTVPHQAQERAALTSGAMFKFAHDRIQQAAYSLIDEQSRAVFHLRIGRRLLAHLSEEEREERIFDLVYQWNRGQSLLTSEEEKTQLARHNLCAGKKAASSAAYMPALNYFQTGIHLGDDNRWSAKQYELTLALYINATQAAYLIGDFQEMEHLAEIVLKNARTLLDQVKIYQIRIHAHILREQSLAAINVALPLLRKLGVPLPTKPTVLHVMRELLATKWAFRGKRSENLDKLPPMTDAIALAAMEILGSIGPAAYLAEPNLTPLIFFSQIRLSLKYGNTVLSGFGYSGYGMILSSGLGDIEGGYRFAQLAAKTLLHFPANAQKARILFLTEAVIKHWKDPLRAGLPALLEIYQSCAQEGDFEYASYAAITYYNFRLSAGIALPKIQKDAEKYVQMMVQSKQESTLHSQKIMHQTVENLRVPSEDPCRLSGVSYNEDSTVIPADNRTALFGFHFNKLMLCYLFGRYPQALEQALAAEQNLKAVVGSPSIPICHAYMALTQLAMFPQASKREQKQILGKVASIQKKLKKWAFHSPSNNLHKWHLVAAEKARVCGKDLVAMSHYDQAIALARRHKFTHEEALANELATQFYFSRKLEKLARNCLRDAHYGYQQWGAIAKVKHLEAKYPELLRYIEADKLKALSATATISANAMNSEALDLATVMKATQAISSEIMLGKLLETLMRIAIENAGAQRGALLLETRREWRIEAEGNVDGNTGHTGVHVLQSRPLMHAGIAGVAGIAGIVEAGGNHTPALPSLPVSLIHYVAQTGKPLVLDNACGRGRFMHDAYISHHQTKSLLCAPILHHGKLAGVLYLENNLTEGAFTADRLEVLKILSAQAAISIENARVYEHLESTVAQRTAALSQSNEALSESNQALSQACTVAESARKQAENAEQQARQALDDLQAAQTQLVQSAKMASLGHLVAGVAHELNTPIGNALTTASVLTDANRELKNAMLKGEMRKSTLDDFLDNAMLMTDIVSRSCQRAATLITSFKQVAADQTSEQRRHFDLDLLVEDNIAALRAGFQQESWRIETAIPENIRCDSFPGPLGQIIANLVQNAATHAFPAGAPGTLKISATRHGAATAEQVKMTFSDDGTGIDANILGHIFEPFYSTQGGQGGPGLGLSIALNIATGVLGGTLTATSVPGCGAQFDLAFPLTAPDRISANGGFSAS